LPVRVAFVGKGGAGKSVIAATVARLVARRPEHVLALDMDTMPGLALSLGAAAGPEGLPSDLAERREGEGWVMRAEVTPEELVDRYSTAAPDGVRLLTLGKLPGHVSPASSTAFRHVAMGFRRTGWSIVGDLAAGTRQAFFGWAGFARVVVLVAEPTSASALSARRLAKLRGSLPQAAFMLVASRVRTGDDPERLARDVGLPLGGVVPYDERVLVAERSERAPLDLEPRSEAIRAIADLIPSLERAG
jgi:CO dehydrogenase maturation factor